MSRLKLLVVILFSILLGYPSAYAQKSVGNLFVNNVYRGDEMFLDFYYEEAIKYYKLALKKDEDNTGLKLKIANSYRLLTDYKSSNQWYEQVLGDSTFTGTPLDKYNYAELLVSSGRYDDAKEWYAKYSIDVADDTRPDRKLLGISHIETFFRDSVTLTLNYLSFNSVFDDMASVYYKDGLVYLSSHKSNSIVEDDFLRDEDPYNLYFVGYDSTLGWATPKLFDASINTAYHEGPLTFYKDQNKLILTRSNIIEGKPIKSKSGETKVQLYDVEKVDERWSKSKKLNFNNTEFSYAHPTISQGNDTLYFSSDMDGGYGGSDIYMSTLSGNQWTEPVNLGSKINTEGDEMYPNFIDNRLFFSSNGHAGLGGLDIFKAFLTNGVVNAVVNVGYPINSNHNDFAYSINKESLTGTFTSNRDGGVGGDDIYGFTFESQVLTGLVAQEQDSTAIPNAEVKLLLGDSLIAITMTDQDGLFNFYLPFETEFNLEVTKDEHFASLPLQVASYRGKIDLDTVQISLHKHDLFAQGRILDNERQKLMPDVRVIIHNLTDNDLDTLFTDVSGLYNFILMPQKQYSIWAGKMGYLIGGVDINTMKIDKGVIINDIVLEAEYTKKSVVRFDYDKYNLKPAAYPILDKIASVMSRSSSDLIISAFADARGTVEYNQKLSNKRAATVLNYLVSQGVDKSRIVARGFGETLILNRCVDGVDCEEVEHSKNRRAEIKIEGSTVR